ncbi:MAG TPA: anaerobic ribonucleoside-triphosphate reductase activating protein [Burkholderiales bacterium]|nr:anaerobic ribonucleoside-triphosphate reductase activating protein [Burkholderiales bacterium]
MPTLRIGGLTPFSATDYPDHLCAVVFCQGCPWRCGYCHNAHLQPSRGAGEVAWSGVLAFLQRRKRVLDAVVFSGGEPTLQSGLAEAMRDVKAMGYKVGLHTAGIYPRRLAEVLPLTDWVGMDVKATFAGYDRVTQTPGSAVRARESMGLVLASGVRHQFRTTVDERVLTPAEVDELTELLAARGEPHLRQKCRPPRR